MKELASEVVWEAVRVVKLERVLRRDPRGSLAVRALDEFAEQARALFERPPEALLLRFEPLVDRVAFCRELGVTGARNLDHRIREAAEKRRFQADLPAL